MAPVPRSLSVYSFIQELPQVAVGTVLNQGTFNFVDEVLQSRTRRNRDRRPRDRTSCRADSSLFRISSSERMRKVRSSEDRPTVPLLDFTMTIDNGDEARQIPIGSQTTTGISRGLRVINDTYTVYLTDVTKSVLRSRRNRTSQPIFIQIGDVAGKLFSIYLPQRTLNTPDIDKTPPEIQMEFTGEAYGYATRNS